MFDHSAAQLRFLNLIFIGMAIGFSVGGCGKPPVPPVTPPPAVRVVELTSEVRAPQRSFIGRVEAIEDAAVQAQVSGYVTERPFAEGSVVQQGDLLFQIDAERYRIAVSMAQAQLAKAQAGLELANAELGRAQLLHERQTISEAEVDQIEAQVAVAQADVGVAEAALEDATWQLEQTAIHAPVTGRTGMANAAIGDLVGPTSGPLTTVASVDPIHVVFSIDEALLTSVRERYAEPDAVDGQVPTPTVYLDLAADPVARSQQAAASSADGMRYPHAGSIAFIDNRVDPRTGSVLVRAEFPNPKAILTPGLYAKVIAERADPIAMLLVPQVAVQEDQLGEFVLIVDEQGQAARRSVDLGSRVGLSRQVLGGLTEGDRVIVDGMQKVRPGLPVTVIADQETPAADVPAQQPEGEPRESAGGGGVLSDSPADAAE